VERWFALITQRAILCGALGSVKELVQKIDDFVQNYNPDPDLLFGRLRPIRFSNRSRAFVHVFPGRDTRESPRSTSLDL